MSDELEVVEEEKPLVRREPTELDAEWRKATAMSQSTMVPKDFRRNPANCYLAMEMANRMGAGTLEVMQSMFVVHGTPGWKAAYVIGMVNRHGPFLGPLRFETNEINGAMAVTCRGVLPDGEVLAKTVSMEDAERAGWTSNPKYREIPEQMLSYRAATLFCRLHAPECMFGLHTTDELDDIGPREVQAEVSETKSKLQQSLLEAEDDRETDSVEQRGDSHERGEIDDKDELPF